jgi:hypothetical protein
VTLVEETQLRVEGESVGGKPLFEGLDLATDGAVHCKAMQLPYP